MRKTIIHTVGDIERERERERKRERERERESEREREKIPTKKNLNKIFKYTSKSFQ